MLRLLMIMFNIVVCICCIPIVIIAFAFIKATEFLARVKYNGFLKGGACGYDKI